MKWLRYFTYVIAGCLGIVLIVLLFLGGGRGQARHVISVDIAKPAKIVFDWIARPENRSLSIGGEGTHLDAEVVQYERDRVLESHVSVTAVLTGTVRYELEPMDLQRTRFTCRATLHYQRWSDRLLEPVISRSVERRLKADIARLKQEIEAH